MAFYELKDGSGGTRDEGDSGGEIFPYPMVTADRGFPPLQGEPVDLFPVPIMRLQMVIQILMMFGMTV